MSQKTPERTVTSNQPLERKVVIYQGFGESQGEVAYVAKGKAIYFSGITLHTTSTINAEEAVIAAICGAENIDWTEAEFFDINTTQGYRSHQPGDYDFLKLHLEPDQNEVSGCRVTQFESILRKEGEHVSRSICIPKESGYLIPADVVNHFHDLIVGGHRDQTIEGTFRVITK